MKRGYLVTSAWGGRGQMLQRAWVLLAILGLLSSMLAWSAIAAKPVLANTGPATKLGFDPGPSATYTADDVINVTVEIQDAAGERVDEGSGSVADITLSAENGAIIEESDLTETTAAGVASFAIHIRNAGSGYHLKATTTAGLTEADSSTFGITAGALTTTVLTPNPESKSADIGEVTYTATGSDAYGNDKGDVTGEVDFDIDGVDSSCATNVCGSRKTGSYIVSDTKTGTAALTITPGALDHFVVETAPTSPATTFVAGESFDVTVTAYDAWNNVKTDYDGTAALSGLADSPGCADCNPIAAKPAEYGDDSLSFTNGVAETTGTGFLAGGAQAVTATGETKTGTSAAFTILPAALHHFTWTSITTPQTANGTFSIEAKAFDTYGNLKTNYNGSPTLSALAASPNGTPSTFPTTLAFASGVGSTSGKAFKASDFTVGTYTADQSFTVTDGSVTKTSNLFAVESAALDRLEFAAVAGTATTPAFDGGQPIDTKVSSVIYSACNAAPPGSADPCLTTSAPVKVLALDAYGNRKPGQSVGITRQAAGHAGTFTGTQPKTTSGGGVGNPPLGEAWFSDLNISTISGTATDSYTLTAASGTKSRISSSFRIVSDLANCTGQTKCFNNTKNNSVDKPENSYSQSKTTIGAFGNVITTTNFANGADVNGQCTSVRTGNTIGSAIDVRVVGSDLSTSKPTTTMVMILPLKTLKFYGLTARNADAYNVCLGAINLNGSTSQADAWTGKDRKNKALPAAQAPDADGINRYWGVPADCGQKYLKPSDPCISLKSKSATQVAVRMAAVTGETWTVARVNSELNYFDGDIAIFVTKPFPWDGKGGLY